MSIKNQNGIALMTVIVFLFLLNLTWLSFSFISSYEREAVQNQVDSEQASYVAEAGIQQALYFLSQDWNWQNWSPTYIAGGTKVTQGTLTYYQWSGNLGDSNQTYTVQIRNDGKTQSKIRVGSPNLDPLDKDPRKRTIEVEIGSAFDFGLYSHDQMKFSSGFTVSGTNSTGYAYAKNGITNPNFLAANKKVGNYSTSPYFLPKEIPLPACGTPKFKAKIIGTPDSTVRYTNDTGEEYLEVEALLRNKTKSNFRIIQVIDIGTKTITAAESQEETDYPEKKWAAGDDIILERIDIYENFWVALNQQLNNLIDEGVGYAPGGGPPYPAIIGINTRFTGSTQFTGNTTFDANIIIEGDAPLGQNFGDTTTLNQGKKMMVQGNISFSHTVQINGYLYVNNGSITIANGATVDIGPNGGIFVRRGGVTCSGAFRIYGYCYVNGDINITSIPTVQLPTLPADTTTIFYSRNGSLTISSSSPFQNFSGWGKIIVGNKVTISPRLSTTDSTKPMKIIAMGDMEIGDRIGSWSSPFYGIIYCGGKLYHTNVWASPRTRIRGSLMAGTYYYKRPDNSEDKFFFSGSVIYDANMKQEMPALGFTNNEDFVRPLLWRETE